MTKKNYIIEKINLIAVIFFSLFTPIRSQQVDLTIVGPIKFCDGLGKISLGIIKSLKDDITIQCIPTSYSTGDLEYAWPQAPASLMNILNTNNLYSSSKVTITTDLLSFFQSLGEKKMLQSVCLPESTITIAYSMFEASAIPISWVPILNTYYDAVVVPDEYVQLAYVNSGVKIPIFVIPCIMFSDEFLKIQTHKTSNTPFVFGNSGFFLRRKNQLKILECFYNEFGNNNNVILKLHGREHFYDNTFECIKKKIAEFNCYNVEIIDESLSWKSYVEFMGSLDCYVFISQGEGFSITPREAIAAGLPCILSNNTVHQTLCKTGFFIDILANKIIPADYSDILVNYTDIFTKMKINGAHFDCKKSDVCRAMRYVYENYANCVARASGGREWVKRYSSSSLRNKYLNLAHPKKILKGPKNEITDDYLMTNDSSLYDKYLKILQN